MTCWRPWTTAITDQPQYPLETGDVASASSGECRIKSPTQIGRKWEVIGESLAKIYSLLFQASDEFSETAMQLQYLNEIKSLFAR